MSTALFLLCLVSWGTSWIAIKFQLAVDPSVSVAYRFLAAGLILQIFYRIKGGVLTNLKLKDHGIFFVHGLLMFCLNYNLVYASSKYLTSGLVALMFSTLAFMNIFNGRLFLKTPIEKNVFLASFLGLTGLVIVFFEELHTTQYSVALITGIIIGLVSTYFASLGNIWVVRFKKSEWSPLRMSAYSMLYGGLVSLTYCLVTGKSMSVPLTVPYVSSFLYLTLFATIGAFGAYLTLLSREGASKAAYIAYLFPILALGISSVVEGYKWTAFNIAGFAIILTGNLILSGKLSPKKLMRRLNEPVVVALPQVNAPEKKSC
ncbi:MAG: EamA family transporter [Bdellovibrionales bacterium]|nr:EamA family transporter [Bdellovibrionales bacterium]